MNKKHIGAALVIGLLIGAAFASKIKAAPVVGKVVKMIPGADA